MSTTTFTEADRKKLEELKAKERQAKQDARNEAKRNDRVCKSLFGMTVKQVHEKLTAEQTEQAGQVNIYEQELRNIADLYGTDIWTLLEYIKTDRQVSYYRKFHTDADAV